MIIQNNKTYSKKARFIVTLLVLSGVLCVLVTAGLIAFGQIVDSNKKLLFFAIFSWVCGFGSLVEMIRHIIGEELIAIKIVLFFKNKLGKSKKPTSYQKEFLNRTSSDTEIKKNSILITGDKGTGKSECINFLTNKINNMTGRKTSLSKMHFCFVDFFNDCEHATQFITNLNDSSLMNFILFLDNINEANSLILEKIFELNEKCLIVMVEENSSSMYKSIFELNNNFKFICVEFKDKVKINENVSLIKEIQTTTILKKKFLFTIWYFCYYYNMFSWSLISKHFSESSIKKNISCRLYLKKLKKIGLIEQFPLNTHYMRFANKSESIHICELDLKDNDKIIFQEIIEILFKKESNYEVKWMAMLCLDCDTINKLEDKRNIFYNAVALGNYKKLLDQLNIHTKNNIQKRRIFSYELGILNYYNGNYQEALKCFKETYKEKTFSTEELCLRVIETMHGSNNKSIKRNIQKALNYLKDKCDNNYKEYAEYWENHINSEKGIFDTNEFKRIREILIRTPSDKRTKTSNFLIEKSIMDELRCSWILLKDEKTYEEIKECYLNEYKEKISFKYYDDLYFCAGTSHYYSIPKAWMENKINLLHKELNKAKVHYDSAITSKYQNNKSKMAAKAKRYDIMLMTNDYENLHSYYNDLLAFNKNAIDEKIDLFIAFSNCLMAKGKILELAFTHRDYYPLKKEIESIKKLIDESTKIYKKYDNKYGVQRNEFIELLFDLLNNFGSNKKFNNTFAYLCKHKNHFYKVEQEYIMKLLRIRKTISYKAVFDTLKYYPIILQ